MTGTAGSSPYGLGVIKAERVCWVWEIWGFRARPWEPHPPHPKVGAGAVSHHWEA